MTEDSPSAALEGMTSGTPTVDDSLDSSAVGTSASPTHPSDPVHNTETEDEQALEWHEVIELQAFSERKVWIEDKIKFLESLSPIEVFTGLDAVRASAAEVPGLPSRAQLEEWVAEHDRIEKETVIFDSGELKKLKKFTKAAAQRNLSPADTDLIELTLTTIYELDKLLHLLRDRSDNLDLLSIRLTWEERRIGAWTELRKGLSDIRDFLTTRAQWSPTVYETLPAEDEPSPEPTLKRRNSVVSVASMASDASSGLSAPGFSRSVRFRLAELLSRDAAQLASRLSSLKHTKIAGAGKTLDKLIDHSRKPVPDELLDEQDKLEDEGINAMEDVGKFIMNMVLQWKKADEVYVETLKDKVAAQTLLEEMDLARLSHPTSRQDASFTSRTAALAKRLSMRENPSGSSSFPRPIHPLFPDQPDSTNAVISLLSLELSFTIEQVKKVETVSKDYHTALEAVRRVEAACKAASTLASRYESCLERLEKGVPSEHGDGSPPDLSSEVCLDSSHHPAFLAALPFIVEGLHKLDTDVVDLLPSARAALLHLEFPGVDPQFKADSTVEIDRLATAQQAAARVREEVTARASALSTVRRVWASMGQVFADSEELRCNVADAIDRQIWRQQLRPSDAPPTPDSPSTSLPPLTISPGSALARVDRMQIQLKQDVSVPIETLTSSVDASLTDYLVQCCTVLENVLGNLRRSARFWDAVRNQAATMTSIRDEAQGLQAQTEDLQVRFVAGIEDVLSGALAGDELLLTEGGLLSGLKRCQDAVRAFSRALPRRVSFLSEKIVLSNAPSQRQAPLLGSFTLETMRQASSYGLPADPSSLDNSVRADSNGYSMLLSGAVRQLEQKSEHFQLAKAAKAADIATASILDHIRRVAEVVGSANQSLAETPTGPVSEHLRNLANDVERVLEVDSLEISRSFSSVRDLLHRLQSMPDSSQAGIKDSIVSSRQHALDAVEDKHAAWKDAISNLRQRVVHAQEEQQAFLAEQSRVEALAAAAEQERLAREATSHAECPDDLDRSAADVAAGTKDVSSAVIRQEEHEFDVFSVETASTEGNTAVTRMQARIAALRRRLRSIHINKVARPSTQSSDLSLPGDDLRHSMDEAFAAVVADAATLACSDTDGPRAGVELQSLQSELDASGEMMRVVHRLADLSLALRHCDDGLSDLLEHIDSYPSPPLGELSTKHASDHTLTPEEQLNSRLAFTRNLIAQMELRYSAVFNDPRAMPEHSRVMQTWNELEAMGTDRVNGTKSRPGSAMSSGRSSRASGTHAPPTSTKKRASGYGKLSVGSANGFLAPPAVTARRTSSGLSTSQHARSMSRVSPAPASRSVSGPIASPSSTLYGSTFASRQRTNSTTSNASIRTPLQQPHLSTSRPRAQTGRTSFTPRTASPAFSEASSVSVSRPGHQHSQSSTSRSSWARAPRQSVSTIPRSPPRNRGGPIVKKPYVANPKNKLDVAVGEVLNRLPVNINVELIADTWRDQSGKYWIGDQDPKLCFCRILRSQTVMVRVGGGWSELSKFIKDHFADAFRILPESPRLGAREEKWVSSATLSLTAASMSPPILPRTPEPKDQFIPSFALSTPSGTSPKLIKTTSSPGSPLAALQFIRRADRELSLRPETPSKVTRPGISLYNTPARQPVWRP